MSSSSSLSSPISSLSTSSVQQRRRGKRDKHAASASASASATAVTAAVVVCSLVEIDNVDSAAMTCTDGTSKTLHVDRQRQQQQHKQQQPVQQNQHQHSKKRPSKALQKHGNDPPSGGMQALLPSLIGVAILACGVMAKMGFRGRATVAGIDLGTTNSVICVQSQTTGTKSSSRSSHQYRSSSDPNRMMGRIDCIADPVTGSPIIPSVVSFLDISEQRFKSQSSSRKAMSAVSKSNPTTTTTTTTKLVPHPSHVVVGQQAKERINSHPHHTIYHAKRVLGRDVDDPAVTHLQSEVDFVLQAVDNVNNNNNNNIGPLQKRQDRNEQVIAFRVPETSRPILPQQIGAYVVHYLKQITAAALGHDNVASAVICVPAKFDAEQRRATVQAFQMAGWTVTRLLEEPTAAALAYGLHRKVGVDYILVYDFGGGTLDVSLLHVSDGYVDVMGSDGDDRLGGADFDDAIAHYLSNEQGMGAVVENVHIALERLEVNLQRRFEQERTMSSLPQEEMEGIDFEQRLASSCPQLSSIPLCTTSSLHTLGERLKIQLSSEIYPDLVQPASAQCLALGDDNAVESAAAAAVAGTNSIVHPNQHDVFGSIESFCASLRPRSLSITLSDFDRVTKSLLDRSILPVHRLLAELDLDHHDIHEVVMVGGTTRLPHIRQLIQDTLPSSTMNVHIDPDLTVAYGAASVID